MTKVVVDLDPIDVWRIQVKAEASGVTPGDVVRDELQVHRTGLAFLDRVRSCVLAGMCDADIAAEMQRTPGAIATARRSMKLPANHRYRYQHNGGRRAA